MNFQKRPLIIAHRGASADFPENSLDAFSGAFATALCEEKSISNSIKFANAFAGISTTRIGTANSMPSREEIDKLL